jgi:hypothetical protein
VYTLPMAKVIDNACRHSQALARFRPFFDRVLVQRVVAETVSAVESLSSGVDS